MALDELRATLLEWLNEFKTWYEPTKQDWNDYIYTDREWTEFNSCGKGCDERPGCLYVVIYTATHQYNISANISDNHHSLGCIAHTRMPRAGETWTRGNDLPDGPLNKKTWDAIIRAIARYEVIAKVKMPAPLVDESPPTAIKGKQCPIGD